MTPAESYTVLLNSARIDTDKIDHFCKSFPTRNYEHYLINGRESYGKFITQWKPDKDILFKDANTHIWGLTKGIKTRLNYFKAGQIIFFDPSDFDIIDTICSLHDIIIVYDRSCLERRQVVILSWQVCNLKSGMKTAQWIKLYNEYCRIYLGKARKFLDSKL